jgi:hypothetical protein
VPAEARRGQAGERESLKRDRDEKMELDTDKKREDRQDFIPLAGPQCGVDAMRDQFTGTEPVPGVVDADAVAHLDLGVHRMPPHVGCRSVPSCP